MADYLKVIPSDHSFVPCHTNLDKAAELLKQYAAEEQCSYELHETPVFIDCGENLTDIGCPYCNSK